MNLFQKFWRRAPQSAAQAASAPPVTAVRNLAAMSPHQVYDLILDEMTLPGWILEPMEALLTELGCRPVIVEDDDFTGKYRYHQIQTASHRFALVYVAGDMVLGAFDRVADFVTRLAGRDWDVLFVFSNAGAIPSGLLERRNSWVQGGRRVTFCQQPEIDRLRILADPASRKAVLRGWFGLDQVAALPAGYAGTPVILEPDARTLLIQAIARAADKQLVPAGYFDRLLDLTVTSADWVRQLQMSFSSSTDENARLLVDAAAAQGSRGAPTGYTVLGSIVDRALQTMQRAEQAAVVSVMVTGKLLTGVEEIKFLSARYQIPTIASGVPGATDLGPDFTFTDPGELELQSYEKQPPLLKLTDIMKCVEQSGAVCLIRVESIQGRTGTGFLVAPDLVLTNCHVLLRDWRMPENGQLAEVERHAPHVELRFRYTAAEKDAADKGRTFTLVKDRPVVKWSPVPKLDYVLLRVDETITSDRGLGPATVSTVVPVTRSAVHIVQHPQGEVMQVDFNTSGVTGVIEDRGLLQYVTRTALGSSGSPCFNEQWEVVGLHHAERRKYSLWSVREGILIRSILQEIQTELKGAK